MAKVLKGTQKNACVMGIHLWIPNQRDPGAKGRIENALEDAERQGFSAVYVHRAKPKLCSRDIHQYESGPAR